MADGTKIEWTDATWNPITGCSVCSAGCKHCYAMKLAGTRMKHHSSRAGLTIDTKAGPVWTGEVRLNDGTNGTSDWMMQPLSWSKPREIFVNAHGDTFHEGVPDEWIDRIFANMAMAPRHRFQVLTKRSARMRRYMTDPEARARVGAAINASTASVGDRARGIWALESWPLANVWLGVSVEDQENANTRIPDLLATPAAVRWLSCEPLLGPVDLNAIKWDVAGYGMLGALPIPDESDDFRYWSHRSQGIDWVVVGGESDKGPRARPMHPDWVRALRDQCAAAGVAFLFKQWGDWLPLRDYAGSGHWPTSEGGCCRLTLSGVTGDTGYPLQRVGKINAGRELDGRTHDARPTEKAA